MPSGSDGDAVEVGADADVIDAGDADHVVEMIDERGERRTWNARGEFPIDAGWRRDRGRVRCALRIRLESVVGLRAFGSRRASHASR